MASCEQRSTVLALATSDATLVGIPASVPALEQPSHQRLQPRAGPRHACRTAPPRQYVLAAGIFDTAIAYISNTATACMVVLNAVSGNIGQAKR